MSASGGGAMPAIQRSTSTDELLSFAASLSTPPNERAASAKVRMTGVVGDFFSAKDE